MPSIDAQPLRLCASAPIGFTATGFAAPNGFAEFAWALPGFSFWMRAALVASVFVSAGATYTTQNFVVNAPTPEFAKQVGDLAEEYRDQIAIEWLGKKLPRWYKPCPVTVKVGQIGAGGATSFCFDRGEVFGWKMNIQGSEERILDSVLPHEISHTIFACHFRRPLPRWADEGAATLVEHDSERQRQEMLLNQVIRTTQRIPLKQLLSMKEYPRDMQQVLTLYAEGYSLASFLVQQGGKARYLKFLEDAHNGSWDEAIARHYSHKDTATLEKNWTGWIMAGMPALKRKDGAVLAANESQQQQQQPAPPRDPNTIVRGQNEDEAPRDMPAVAGRTLAASSQASIRNADWNTSNARERLPRPAPLGTRPVSDLRPVSDSRPQVPHGPRTAPQFEDDEITLRREPAAAPHTIPDNDEAVRTASELRDDAQPLPDPRTTTQHDPDFAEPRSTAISRSQEWSAFPQARTAPRVTGKNEPSRPLSP